jgi:hypothetical protein
MYKLEDYIRFAFLAATLWIIHDQIAVIFMIAFICVYVDKLENRIHKLEQQD